MIKVITSVELPVGENLTIKKNSLFPENCTGDEKRICIVTGTHGDELEGQYVCYELIRRVKEHPECLTGIVDVYPAVNPLGIDTVNRFFPVYDVDMNCIFPGSTEGTLPEYIANCLVEDLLGADCCIDIHASDIHIKEIPQVRMSSEMAEKLLPYAKLLNTEFVLVHEASTVRASTLSHTLNNMSIPTLVVEMGVGMRITKELCYPLVDGIFALMKELGIWNGETVEPREPITSVGRPVVLVNTTRPGIFVPCVNHGQMVKKGDKIGEIVNPLLGELEEELFASVSGYLFTLREYPMCEEGSIIARILGGNE